MDHFCDDDDFPTAGFDNSLAGGRSTTAPRELIELRAELETVKVERDELKAQVRENSEGYLDSLAAFQSHIKLDERILELEDEARERTAAIEEFLNANS